MKISKNLVATMAYILTDENGDEIDSSKINGPLVYLHGNKQLIEGLEKSLEGLNEGDKIEVNLSPEEGYGVRRKELIHEVPKSEFANVDVEIGMHFQTETDDGEVMEFEVVEIRDDSLIMDANHPLAGRSLKFNIEILEVRKASEDEIKHGHAHGDNGHSH